jgi:hypothetical protein
MNRSRLFSLVVLLLAAAVDVHAAQMQRLVRIADATTLVVEHDGLQTAVSLSAVDVPPARRAETVAYLETMVGAWVLVEQGNVYRSPDGVFVNAEVRRRLAGGAAPPVELHPMTVLGVSAPGPSRTTTTTKTPRAPARTPKERAPKERARDDRPVKPRRTSPAHRQWHAPK